MSADSVPIHEYTALTQGVGLLDRSERGKLALAGADAKTFLHGQVSQDIAGLSTGHGAYAALLTNKGKMLADLRVLDAGPELLLDTERIALQELFNTVRRFSIGYAVALHKRTLQNGLLSLIGPHSEALLGAAGLSLPAGALASEHDHLMAELARSHIRVIRTDLGFDLLTDAEATATVAMSLLDAGAVAVTAGAAEVVRVETGRPRYGIDLDDSVIPQEAGLNERAVCFTKGCYVGQETVARLFYRGKPNRELRGLRAQAPLVPGAQLLWEGRSVATVTSAAASPRWGSIGLALVRREAPPGTRVETSDGVAVEVVALPFA